MDPGRSAGRRFFLFHENLLVSFQYRLYSLLHVKIRISNSLWCIGSYDMDNTHLALERHVLQVHATHAGRSSKQRRPKYDTQVRDRHLID